MEIKEDKLLLGVRLEGKGLQVFENVLIDTGAAFTVVPQVISDFLELETNRAFPKAILTITKPFSLQAPAKFICVR